MCRRDPTYTGFANPIKYAAYDSGLSVGNGYGGNEADSVSVSLEEVKVGKQTLGKQPVMSSNFHECRVAASYLTVSQQ